MYWYQFKDEDFELAFKQAEAQGNDSKKMDKIRPKLNGNLGEYAFRAFLRDFANPAAWTYENQEAHEESRPEYSEYDFNLNGTHIDVKTVSNIMRYDPAGMVMGSPDQPWINISQDDEASYYVFSVVFADLLDLHSDPDYEYSSGDYGHNAALLLGWAIEEDLIREGHVVIEGGRRTSGVYFPIRGLQELLWRTDCLPHPKEE